MLILQYIEQLCIDLSLSLSPMQRHYAANIAPALLVPLLLQPVAAIVVIVATACFAAAAAVDRSCSYCSYCRCYY